MMVETMHHPMEGPRTSQQNARLVLSCTVLLLVFSAAAFPRSVHAQDKDAIHAFFEHLVGGTWEADGTWQNGSPFVQHQQYAWGPGKAFIMVKSFGPVESTAGGTDMEWRNEGIRAWDADSGTMRFWEFDRYGGITTGGVSLQGDVLVYDYVYTSDGADMHIRETLSIQSPSSIGYRIGTWTDGSWSQLMLETTLRRSQGGEDSTQG